MDPIIQVILSLMPENSSQSDAKKLKLILGLNDANLVNSVNDLDPEDFQKSFTVADIASKMRELGYEISLPGKVANANHKSFPIGFSEPEPELESDSHKSFAQNVYQTRFGTPDAARKAILEDVVGKDAQHVMYEQETVFAKAMRGGERALSSDETRVARRQLFPVDAVFDAVTRNGMTVKSMKALQVEAQGELGGFAVPSTMQTEIRKRLPAVTQVRGGGARVIQLNSKSTDIPIWRGNGNNYVGLLRLSWEGEGATPGAQNWKMDMQPVRANLMTFKIEHSQSLVEDAANLTSMMMEDIIATVAVGEDFAFVSGDGVGKPLGILPGNSNQNSIAEVNSGAASLLTVAGIKALKRGVASQYRRNSNWLANSDTYGIIEAFTVGAGTTNWAFPDLSEGEMLLKKAALESEAMSDVATNSYPLLFGNFAGYTIVERLGLAIERFHDSGTGINRVEYHVRKRVGGILTEPWQFAVQKISA